MIDKTINTLCIMAYICYIFGLLLALCNMMIGVVLIGAATFAGLLAAMGMSTLLLFDYFKRRKNESNNGQYKCRNVCR